MSRDFKLTEEEINRAILRSPYALPNSPSQKGLNASQIKKYFYDFIRSLAESLNIHFDDINLSMAQLDQLIAQINERLSQEKNEEGTENEEEGKTEETVGIKAIEEHNQSSTAHSDLREDLETACYNSTRALNIAKGKNRITVFPTVEKMFEYIDIHRNYEETGSIGFESIGQGDVFIIAQRGKPEFSVLQLSRYDDTLTRDISASDISSTEFKAGEIYYYTKKNITLIGMEGGADTSAITDLSQVRGEIEAHNVSNLAHSDIRSQLSQKQNKLTAGDNIVIDANGKISSTLSLNDDGVLDLSSKLDKVTEVTANAQAYIKNPNGEQGVINIVNSGSVPNREELVTGNVIVFEFNSFAANVENQLANKQDKLIAGDNIIIGEDGTISAIGGVGSADTSNFVTKDALSQTEYEIVESANNYTNETVTSLNQYITNTYATKEELGNIDTALDSIIAIQNSLIGGEA